MLNMQIEVPLHVRVHVCFLLNKGDDQKKKKQIVDLTIACPEARALGITELTLNTLQPRCFKVFCRVYPLEGVPTQDDALRHWLYARWQEKDDLLAEFYRTDTFPQAPATSDDLLRKWEVRAPMRKLKYSCTEMLKFHAFWAALAFVSFGVGSMFLGSLLSSVFHVRF